MPKDSRSHEDTAAVTGRASNDAPLLHPVFVLRIAGEACAPWQALHDGATRAALASLHADSERIAALAPAACAALEAAIGRAGEEREARRLLLGARRALFNGRPAPLLEAPVAAAIAAWCGRDDDAVFAELRALAARRACADASFAACVEAELARSVDRLRTAAAGAPALLGGIHYTNPALYALGERWLRAGSPDTDKSARRLQATALDFALRAAFKTSPFSSFTSAVAGEWEARGDDCGNGADLGQRGQRMRLGWNHGFFHYLLEDVWRDPACLGPSMAFEVNPTLRSEGDTLHWQQLTRSSTRHARFWGASHPARRIRAGAPVRAFLAAAARLAAPFARAALEEALAADLPAQPPAAIAGFVDTLIQLDLLHPHWPRRQQDDMLAATMALSDGLTEAARARIGAACRALQAAGAGYAQADLPGRVALRRRIDAAAAAMEAPAGAPATRPRVPPLFEDCTLDGPRPRASCARWAAVLEDLGSWLALLPLFDGAIGLQSWLAARFIDAYGKDGECGDIEGFLRTLEDALPPAPAVPGPPTALATEALALRHELLDAMLGGGGAHELKLDAAWCRALAARMPAALRRRGVSLTLFGQRLDDAPVPAGFVLNRAYPGGSTMMSRFMVDLPDAALAPVRAYLRRRTPGGRYLALPGVFGFNANLHPRLAEAEALPAGAQPGHAVKVQDLAQLRLVYNGGTDRLDVRDAAGQVHELLYFGFLQARNLPLPYRLLARNASALPELWEALAMHQGGGEDRPRALPRVSIGGVVLVRRTWIVPRACLPDARAALPAFVLAFDGLRRSLGLPDEVFVRLPPGRPGKPFYVHLDSPLHLRQLAAALRGGAGQAVFQEALPAPGVGTVRLNGRAHVAEMQIELTVPESKTETAP